jgi:hypothetical protein
MIEGRIFDRKFCVQFASITRVATGLRLGAGLRLAVAMNGGHDHNESSAPHPCLWNAFWFPDTRRPDVVVQAKTLAGS